MLKGIIISLALTLVWVATQIAVFHISRPRRVFLSMVCLFLTSIPLFIIIYLLTPPDLFFLPLHCTLAPLWLGLSTGFLVHLLFFSMYVEFFYYIERSVTLRLLVEFGRGSRTTLDDIQEVYNIDKMVAERLEAMKENGFTELRDGIWHLTGRGKLFARTFILCRRILNLGPGQ